MTILDGKKKIANAVKRASKGTLDDPAKPDRRE